MHSNDFSPILRAGALGIVVLASACASSPAVRNLADQTAAAASRYATAANAHAGRQATAAVSEASQSARLRAAAASNRAEADRLRTSWALSGDKSRSDRYAMVSAVSAEMLIGAPDATAQAASASRPVTLDLAQPIKGLTEISAPQRPFSGLVFLGEFWGLVQGEADRIRAEAETSKK